MSRKTLSESTHRILGREAEALKSGCPVENQIGLEEDKEKGEQYDFPERFFSLIFTH